MSPRRRLGVALLLDPPVAVEVDGLRRALGDSSLTAVAPHLTLVPPINVRTGDLDDALGIMRRAAAAHPGPLHLSLGPAATFVPASPVVYLAVGGPDFDRLASLRDDVLSGPFLRPDRWPWVPHVTIADQAMAPLAEAALTALKHYQAEAGFERVVVLEERQHRWHPLADADLGPPVVVGRGGLELEITQGRLLGPDVLALVETELGETGCGPAQANPALANDEEPSGGHGPGAGGESIVLTGRREGRVAGVAAAWSSGATGEPVSVSVLVDRACRRQGVGRSLLVALEMSVGRRGWALEGVRGYGPSAFFNQSSAWVRTVAPAFDAAGPSGGGGDGGHRPARR